MHCHPPSIQKCIDPPIVPGFPEVSQLAPELITAEKQCLEVFSQISFDQSRRFDFQSHCLHRILIVTANLEIPTSFINNAGLIISNIW